jgi:hypothetical protein
MKTKTPNAQRPTPNIEWSENGRVREEFPRYTSSGKKIQRSTPNVQRPTPNGRQTYASIWENGCWDSVRGSFDELMGKQAVVTAAGENRHALGVENGVHSSRD